MTSQNPDYGWCHIESRFEGPGSTKSGNQFVLSVILQPGVENLCSGIHVVVCYKEDDPELRELAVKDNVGNVWFVKRQREWALTAPAGTARARQILVDRNEALLAEQEAAHRASDALLEHGLPALDLPLCTVAYEIQDCSNDTWRRAKLVLLPSWPIVDGPVRKIAYQFVQLTHDPVVLYLSFNHTLRGSLKPNNKSGLVCAYPTSMGISAATVHILPGSHRHRRIFTQPPPEILSIIFGCAVENKYGSWRPTLVSFALVCRDWVVALEHLFHDFGTYTSGKTAPDLIAVSKCVQAKSQLGNAIWSLSRSHFGRELAYNDEQKYLERAIAFKNILHSAKYVRKLEIFDTHSSLREEFVEALSQSRDVRSFLINRYSVDEQDEQKYWCLPTLPDLFRCFSRWERLHELQLYGWDGPNPFLQTVQQFTIDQTPPLSCALKTITLATGPITAPQLSNLTAGSHASLSDLHLSGVIGLSNAGLKDWLFEAGGSLQSLNIEKCSIAKTGDDEEYALDAAMGHLTALSNLRVEGDIVSELAVLRKIASTERYRRDTITLDNCPGVNPHGLVQALKSTGWSTISARRVFEGNEPLMEEGKAVAKGRGIHLW
ncbi:hypothetical protein MSAN_01850000 [Mycena sanguinolenta]|uniref:Uncharacterized protein n=1 Tax=Mycena sanguinolenta TaxID=230812 RepID=A0A8H6XQN2_9AGAR|nr:hypothetical protein MSAN_01850000 [Mycena sanguinolenta]